MHFAKKIAGLACRIAAWDVCHAKPNRSPTAVGFLWLPYILYWRGGRPSTFYSHDFCASFCFPSIVSFYAFSFCVLLCCISALYHVSGLLLGILSFQPFSALMFRHFRTRSSESFMREHVLGFGVRAEFLNVTWVSSRPQVIDFRLFGIFRSSLTFNCPLAVPWSQGTDRSTLALPWLLLGFLDNCRHDIIYRRFKLNF